VLKDSGRFAGLVGLVPLLAPFGQLPCFGGTEQAPFSAEVGLFWALLPEMQGHGFATEAVCALTAYAGTTLKLARIMASTTYDNTASIAVMQRLGMRIEKNPFPDPAWFQITGILALNQSAERYAVAYLMAGTGRRNSRRRSVASLTRSSHS
jgi:hypothetical protein